jgi:tRNA pseudouridine38-40 synthase
MRNIKLTLEYDGTEFCGWQRQASDRTVQAEVERSLSMLTEETVKVTAAGRTDSGVHARGQVINFKTAGSLSLNTFVRGGNSRLPRDVRILAAEEVDLDFSARYSAKARLYRYFIAKQHSAVGRQYAWYYWNPLDINAMRAVCASILGSHDFSSFCQSNADVDHYLCDVRHAWWLENDDFYIFEICANRFLHNMVRILVGTMAEMGGERSLLKSMAEILASLDRNAAGPTAPAPGLFLMKVFYE